MNKERIFDVKNNINNDKKIVNQIYKENNKKYFITTYGCQLNVHESEKLAGVLEELGFTHTEQMAEAKIIIYNTCAIREGAEDRALGNIGSLKKFKQKNKDVILIVCGCMTQQKENAQKLKNMFPFIDIILGTSNLHEFKSILLNFIKEHKKICNINDDFNLTSENMPLYRTSGENAWVNIMQGCNNFCSYCIVPYVRGRERSRPLKDIIQEIKHIIKENKYKKITLLGQNVNSYGNDLKENEFQEKPTFAKLLKEICSLEGDFKLTFMTSHPKDLTSDVIDVIANNDKMLKEIHLPIQSGSNKILKLMNRNYSVEKYLSIINEIKEKIPNVRLSTDIIVGFPQETDEDFNETLELLKKVKYDNVFAFMYSKRSGTPASVMEGQVDEKVKKIRVNKVLQLVKSLSKK